MRREQAGSTGTVSNSNGDSFIKTTRLLLHQPSACPHYKYRVDKPGLRRWCAHHRTTCVLNSIGFTVKFMLQESRWWLFSPDFQTPSETLRKERGRYRLRVSVNALAHGNGTASVSARALTQHSRIPILCSLRLTSKNSLRKTITSQSLKQRLTGPKRDAKS